MMLENKLILQENFYSSGKLLLSGEYLVLKGAEAVALPLKVGQGLQINSLQTEEDAFLHWKSYEHEVLWFEMKAHLHDLSLIESSDLLIANRLLDILKQARLINEDFLTVTKIVTVKATLDFDRNFGFGSSSTLIANIAEWANIGPYALLEKTFGGSGYDIACAKSNGPIMFCLHGQLPMIKPLLFKPLFSEQLFFIYSGKKQSSAKAIKDFSNSSPLNEEVKEVTKISRQLIKATTLSEFQSLIIAHENLLSSILGKPSINELYSDFEGSLKSLGAWGGDFILAASKLSHSKVKEYFKSRGLTTIFRYQDIVK